MRDMEEDVYAGSEHIYTAHTHDTQMLKYFKLAPHLTELLK